jgi:hypothetical protein
VTEKDRTLYSQIHSPHPLTVSYFAQAYIHLLKPQSQVILNIPNMYQKRKEKNTKHVYKKEREKKN